jgi:hypothetical protein
MFTYLQGEFLTEFNIVNIFSYLYNMFTKRLALVVGPASAKRTKEKG